MNIMPNTDNKRKTKKLCRKERLIVTVCLVIIVGISATVYYAFDLEQDLPILNEEYLEISTKLLSSVNTSVDPCDDFYQFTCGNFETTVNTSYYFHYHNRIEDMINAQIMKPSHKNDSEKFLLQRIFYHSCMDVETIDGDGNEILKNILEELGGWPVVTGKEWDDVNFDVSEIISKCRKLGLPFQWFFDIVYDEKHNQLRIELPLAPDRNEEYAYLNLMVNVIYELGASKLLATDEMNRTLHFERELQAVIEKHFQSCMDEVDINDLHEAVPRFSWFNLINNIYEDTNFSNLTNLENVTLTSNYKYLMDLNVLLARTSKRIQADYIIWKVIQELGLYLSSPIREHFETFKMVEENKTSIRSKICLIEAKTRLPEVNMDKTTMNNLNQIFFHIQEQFIERISNASWIENDTKEEIINNFIEASYDEYGDTLDLSGEMSEIFLKFNFSSKNIIDIVKEINLNSFKQNAVLPDITPINQLIKNIITMVSEIRPDSSMVARLEDNFYSDLWPNFFNYGGLGTIIGRELVKSALDLVVENKLDFIKSCNDTIIYATDKADENICTKKSLGSDNEYEIQDETNKYISIDILGVDIAYKAYAKWLEENNEEEIIPAYTPFSPTESYTYTQLFWIQFGLLKCNRIEKDDNWIILEEVYPYLKQTVINSVRNSENFAIDFECTEDTPMNPVEKCFSD